MSPLSLFIVLQFLDLVTTLGAIALGGGEMNPVVGGIMWLGPVRGLLLSKAIVIGLAAGGGFLGKHRGIRCANVVFAAVLAWNCSIMARLAMG